MNLRHIFFSDPRTSLASRRLLPDHMELRLFLLQPAQLSQHFHLVAALRQHQAVSQHGHQNRKFIAALLSQSLSRKSFVQPCHGTDAPCGHLLHGLVLRPAVDSQLIHFLLPDLRIRPRTVRIAHGHPHPQNAPCDFQMGQPVSRAVSGYLIHPGGKVRPVFRTYDIAPDASKQLQKPLHPQGRAKITGKNMTLFYGLRHGKVRQLPCLQILFQQGLITHGKALPMNLPSLLRLRTEFQAPAVQLRLKFTEELFLVRIRLIHLVDKKESRDPVLSQEPPQSLHMSLHAVRPADNQNRIVKHLQSAFHLRAEIHMPRGI